MHTSQSIDPNKEAPGLAASRRSMNTQRQVTSVTTKHWSDYFATTFGPECGRIARSSSYAASCALARNPLGIVLPACCSLSRSRGAHGTLSVIEQLPMSHGLPLSWWLLTGCTKKVLAFQLRTLILPRTLKMHLFPMRFQSVASLSMYPPTTRLSLLPLTRLAPSNTPTLHVRSPPFSQRSVERVNSTLGQYLRMYCTYEQDNGSKATSRIAMTALRM